MAATINPIGFKVVYQGSNDCFSNIRKENFRKNEYFDLARKIMKMILKTYFGRKFFSSSYAYQVFKMKHLHNSNYLNGLIMHASKTTRLSLS